MILLNFQTNQPDAPEEKDSLTDDPIPTYEEFLNEAAEDLTKESWAFIAKGAIEFVKFLFTREQLLIQLLVQKDVLQQHEVDEFFGDKAHKETQKQGIKQLTRHMLRAASQGELIGPGGKTLDPDTILVLLNDILDLNNTGWNGRTLEIFMDMTGHEGSLRKGYEEEVAGIERCNKLKASRRQSRERTRELEKRQRVERERLVRIYVSKCRVHDKPIPNDDMQRLMVDGNMPIPKTPE